MHFCQSIATEKKTQPNGRSSSAFAVGNIYCASRMEQCAQVFLKQPSGVNTKSAAWLFHWLLVFVSEIGKLEFSPPTGVPHTSPTYHHHTANHHPSHHFEQGGLWIALVQVKGSSSCVIIAVPPMTSHNLW